MKPLSCLLPVVLACLSLQGQTQDPAKIANIEEIFKLAKVDQWQQQMFAQMQTMMTAQMEKMPGRPKDTSEGRELQDRMFGLLQDRMSWAKMKPQMVSLYDETFTAVEIAGMLEFYKSPAGTAMLEKMPVLLSKMMTLSQTMLGDFMPELQRIRDEVKAKHNAKEPSPSRP